MVEEEKEEKLFPDMEEFMDAAPNPVEVRKEVEEDLQEGVDEAFELRERVRAVFKKRSYRPSKAEHYEVLEKALDRLGDETTKAVNRMKATVDEFLGEHNGAGLYTPSGKGKPDTEDR